MATDSQFMSWFDAFIVPSAFNCLVVRPGSHWTMGSRKHNPKTLCHVMLMLLCRRSVNHSGWLIDLSGKGNFHSRWCSVLFPNFNKLDCLVTYWGLCTSLPGHLHPLSGQWPGRSSVDFNPKCGGIFQVITGENCIFLCLCVYCCPSSCLLRCFSAPRFGYHVVSELSGQWYTNAAGIKDFITCAAL